MKKRLLPDNHFTLRTSPEIQNICQPLFDRMNLSYFSYLRVFPDGKTMNLINSPLWFKYAYENACRAMVPKPTTDNNISGPIISLWEQHARSTTLKAFNDHGFFKAIVFIHRCPNYNEGFSFGSKFDATRAIEGYFNNLPILNKFCDYFHKIATQYVERAEREDGFIYLLDSQIHLAADQSAENINGEKNKIIIDNYEVALSNKQRQCLELLAKGFSAKEIGLKLDISSRTVETHLGNIKQKFNVHYKSELLHIWNEALIL